MKSKFLPLVEILTYFSMPLTRVSQMPNFLLSYLRLLKAVRSLPSAEALEQRIKELHEARSIDVTKRFSRGNVSLQAGQYITATELDECYGGIAPWRAH